MKGLCSPDPGQTVNELVLVKRGGECSVVVRWEWDTLSLYPNCTGTVIAVVVTNNGAEPWTLRITSTTKGARSISIPPGTTTYSGGPLNQMGLSRVQDVSDFLLAR